MRGPTYHEYSHQGKVAWRSGELSVKELPIPKPVCLSNLNKRRPNKHILPCQARSRDHHRNDQARHLEILGLIVFNSGRFLSKRPYVALGLEGSANKLGAVIIKRSTILLSNIRHTYITPPGEGFLPQDTARHHRERIHSILEDVWLTRDPKEKRCFTLEFVRLPCIAS